MVQAEGLWTPGWAYAPFSLILIGTFIYQESAGIEMIEEMPWVLVEEEKQTWLSSYKLKLNPIP